MAKRECAASDDGGGPLRLAKMGTLCFRVNSGHD